MIEPTLRAFDVDPDLDDQWALKNTGQTGGTPDADLDGLEAWALGTGAGQTVAVIDSGADLDHPDLDANLQPGVDYVEPSTPPEDTSGHGTHVSGIIAAEYDNGIGVAGLAHGAKVVPLRVMSGFNGSLQRILDAFEYAGSSGARVANASLGTVPITDAEDAAQIRDLFNAVMARHPDTLYVVAAGNSANNNDARPVFPCNATAANLVCVAASDDNDAMTEFSNYGQQSVDVFAPGDEIFSTWKGDTYADADGTSMAAPQVSAIAALVLSAAPNLPTAALKEAIFETGEVPTGPDLTVTHRRVNALAALEWLGVDEDGDGSANGTDNCWRSMDTGDPDGDGVGGTCDLTPRGVDADGDGKPAVDDSCPSVYGTLANGCPAPPPPPNTDGDGFIDAADACPTERAQTRNGCPLPALTGLSGKVTKRGSRRYVTVRASTTRAAVVRILVQRKKGTKWVKVKKRTLATSANRVTLTVSRLQARPPPDRGGRLQQRRLRHVGHPVLPRPVDIRGCPPAASASSPSGTRSRTAAGSCSGASRCSRGRCGPPAGSASRTPRTRRTARPSRTWWRARSRRPAPTCGTTSAACTSAPTTCGSRPGTATRSSATTGAALAFLAERCERVLTATVPLDLGRPRPRSAVAEANAAIEASAAAAGALVLDLRGFGARNLMMADHVHPTAFGQIAIAERALDLLSGHGLEPRLRPSSLISYETSARGRLRGDLTYTYRHAKISARAALISASASARRRRRRAA